MKRTNYCSNLLLLSFAILVCGREDVDMSYFHFNADKYSGNAPLYVSFQYIRPSDGDSNTQMYSIHRYECPGTNTVTPFKTIN